MIFDKDTEAILRSEIIIADADNNSVGTTAEMGQVWGINYIFKRIGHILETAENAYELRILLAQLAGEIPYKEVHWQITDIPESGHRCSHSINQYLHGLMKDF